MTTANVKIRRPRRGLLLVLLSPALLLNTVSSRANHLLPGYDITRSALHYQSSGRALNAAFRALFLPFTLDIYSHNILLLYTSFLSRHQLVLHIP